MTCPRTCGTSRTGVRAPSEAEPHARHIQSTRSQVLEVWVWQYQGCQAFIKPSGLAASGGSGDPAGPEPGNQDATSPRGLQRPGPVKPCLSVDEGPPRRAAEEEENGSSLPRQPVRVMPFLRPRSGSGLCAKHSHIPCVSLVSEQQLPGIFSCTDLFLIVSEAHPEVSGIRRWQGILPESQEYTSQALWDLCQTCWNVRPKTSPASRSCSQSCSSDGGAWDFGGVGEP